MKDKYTLVHEGLSQWINSPNNGGECCQTWADTVDELNRLLARIKRLEEFVDQLTNPKFTRDDLPKEALLQRIKRLEEAGKELRECASWVGHACCEYADKIRRAEDAVKAWDKEAKP